MGHVTVRRGDSADFTLPIKDSAGDAYNLTGCTLWFTVKRDRNDADPGVVSPAPYWVHGGASAGIVVASPASGVATISLTAAQTAVLTNVGYVYDAQVRAADGKIYTVDSGSLGVALDVTQRTSVP